jgi:hypothetical protein
MQKNLVAIHLIIFVISTNLAASSIPLSEAISKKLVSVEAFGTGGHSGESLKLTLRNLGAKGLELAIPAGLIFPSQDTFLQDLIVIRSESVVLEKGQNRIVRLFGICAQASYGSPGEGSVFKVGRMAEGALAQVVRYIDEHRITDNAAQHAVWAVTDGHSVANINNDELKKLTAELTGQKYVPYTVRHAPTPSEGYVVRRATVTEVTTYEPAFRPNPIVIEGLFEYQTDSDIIASFGIYNEQGEMIHPLFKSRRQIKGFHKFKFTFEIRNLPKGKYFARMTSGQRILGEMPIEW